MSVRAALVLGFLLVLAALVHGGIWSPGNDFVVNRFTGAYEFVPGEEEEDWDGTVAFSRADGCTLTSRRVAGGVASLRRRR